MSFVVHRVSKSAARYTDAGGREKCGYCRFFVAPRACGKVIGPVSPRGWCKYFSREAAQQYSGAGITGGGGPPGATLALDFMSSGNLPAGVTFSRASTATYTDASGTIQTAAVNQPRWDYAGGSLRGLLIEEARTNLALQSGDMSNAAWIKLGQSGPAAPVVTANQTTAPDGTLTASRVAFPAVSGAGAMSVLYQTPTLSTVAYSFSVWLRGSVGGEQVYFSMNPGGPPFYETPRLVLTTQWQRYTLTTAALVAGSWAIIIGTDLRGPTETSTPAATVFIWGAQIEAGSFPTSYIPTTGAVTRAQDSCGIPPANMSPWFASPGGSWFAEFVNFDAVTARNSRVVSQATSGGIAPLQDTNTFVLAQFDGVAAVATANTIGANVISRGVSTWTPGQAKICLNGGAVVTGATLTNGYPMAAFGVGFMSNTAFAATDNMSGYLRRVQYWPRALSNAEMQQVTT
jgi:hypothetical protein